MTVDPATDELSHFRKLEQVLIAKIILFKKVAKKHRKGEFFKGKEGFATFPLKLKIYAKFYRGQPFPMD